MPVTYRLTTSCRWLGPGAVGRQNGRRARLTGSRSIPTICGSSPPLRTAKREHRDRWNGIRRIAANTAPMSATSSLWWMSMT